ncbi:MAG TPA: c-type cytochrome [Rhodanobacteraceae bacterium]|nr:c-type cytochrome [Rhodanobacteraceae bacterium]
MSFRRVFALSLLIAAGAASAQTPEGQQAQPNTATPSASPVAPPSQASPQPQEKAPAEKAPSGLTLGDAKAGEGKAATCSACHGMDGNATDKTYPKLAGQNEAYVVRQLGLMKGGKRTNPVMMPFIGNLSDQDLHDLGAFYASKTSLPGVADEKLLARGQALYRGGDTTLGVPACMACHGPDGRGMAGAGYPQVAGQWADYIQAKLKDFKNGTTWGDDNNARIMPEIAKHLGDSDIAALASYVEGLHSAASDAKATAAR